jgi:hypothetical protein
VLPGTDSGQLSSPEGRSALVAASTLARATLLTTALAARTAGATRRYRSYQTTKPINRHDQTLSYRLLSPASELTARCDRQPSVKDSHQEHSVASSSVELSQTEWDGAGPVGGPCDLLAGWVVQQPCGVHGKEVAQAGDAPADGRRCRCGR